ATAAIYNRIARTYDKLHRYVDIIIYERAAVALGEAEYAHMICYGYHKLELYDLAVRECTNAIETTASLLARYWRGLTYWDADQPSKALPDLAIVAESGHDVRTSAAISMSAIYSNLGESRQALAILNKYTFLYNTDIQNKTDIADAYNNRCRVNL